MCQFSGKLAHMVQNFDFFETDNFEIFFGLNLEKLPNLVQYFGYNNVDGFAKSWFETDMSWSEADRAGWR